MSTSTYVMLETCQIEHMSFYQWDRYGWRTLRFNPLFNCWANQTTRGQISQSREGVRQQYSDFKTTVEGPAREICSAGDILGKNGIVGSGLECSKAYSTHVRTPRPSPMTSLPLAAVRAAKAPSASSSGKVPPR